MPETKSFTGVVQEVSQTGSSDRAPRKVMINDGGEFSKTFRCWPYKEKDSDVLDPIFEQLANSLNKTVTVRYVEEPKQSQHGTYTQNTIRGLGGFNDSKGPNENGSWGGGALTKEDVVQIVREELRLANVYSAFPGTTDETPDYTAFLNKAQEEGTNENGLEKRWAKLFGEGEWHHGTEEQLETLAKDLGFEFPAKSAEKLPEGAF